MPKMNKSYYEKLDGFSYVLDELRKKIGTPQTDVLMTDAINLLIKYISREEVISLIEESARIGV